MGRSFKWLLILSTVVSCLLAQEEKEDSHEVLGLGSAFIDYIIQVNDNQLLDLKYEKGSWAPIEYDCLKKILDTNDEKINTFHGGSGANVIKGLAQLGHHCAIVGQVGSDKEGLYYLKSLEKLDIRSLLQVGSLPTGQAVCFITPDGQKTMRSYAGASHSEESVKIDSKVFEGISLFHIESYQLQNPKIFKQALDLALSSGAKVSLDLSSVGIVRKFKDELLNILPKYVDIVLGNQEEFFELTNLPPQEACDFLGSFCDVVAITMGSEGSWVKSGSVKIYTPSINVSVVDTTGAGDLFASGFLYGYLQHMPVHTCAWLGTYMASKVIQILGAEISEKDWPEIYRVINELKTTFVANSAK